MLFIHHRTAMENSLVASGLHVIPDCGPAVPTRIEEIVKESKRQHGSCSPFGLTRFALRS
jgi:hypothetical protein